MMTGESVGIYITTPPLPYPTLLICGFNASGRLDILGLKDCKDNNTFGLDYNLKDPISKVLQLTWNFMILFYWSDLFEGSV